MNALLSRALCGFYENELKSNFLTFWLSRCEDTEYGGFLNCFDNTGSQLVSTDKYTWSQGRFIWIFSKLALTKAPIFLRSEREEFLRLAQQGTQFLMNHCLMGKNDYRCIFLLEQNGTGKYPPGIDRLDASIYADCFVVAGISLYALAAKDRKAFDFATAIYNSITKRVAEGTFATLPYPLPHTLRAHGIPMILSSISADMYLAAQYFSPHNTHIYLEKMDKYTSDTLMNFLDDDFLIHEVILNSNSFFDKTLGQHINPGHSIEDSWFMYNSAQYTKNSTWIDTITSMLLKTLQTGWDTEFGGILHYAGMHGGQPVGDNSGYEQEPMTKQLAGWGDKLWWVHSEALYATLRAYSITKDPVFLQWHDKIFDYTYKTFPNPDREVREWIQIRDRSGAPKNQIVALPVKDPYHIMRNLILCIEVLLQL